MPCSSFAPFLYTTMAFAGETLLLLWTDPHFNFSLWLGWQISYPIQAGEGPTSGYVGTRLSSAADNHLCGIGHIPIPLVFDKPLKESCFGAICSETC